MSKIYAEMFLADSWIKDHNLISATDTTAVYEPIFQKYGYNTTDFRYSMYYYLNDADRFSKMIGKSKHILQVLLKNVNKEIKLKEYIINGDDNLFIALCNNTNKNKRVIDSLTQLVYPLFPIVAIDSLNNLSDTTFSGPCIVVRQYLPIKIHNKDFKFIDNE